MAFQKTKLKRLKTGKAEDNIVSRNTEQYCTVPRNRYVWHRGWSKMGIGWEGGWAGEDWADNFSIFKPLPLEEPSSFSVAMFWPLYSPASLAGRAKIPSLHFLQWPGKATPQLGCWLVGWPEDTEHLLDLYLLTTWVKDSCWDITFKKLAIVPIISELCWKIKHGQRWNYMYTLVCLHYTSSYCRDQQALFICSAQLRALLNSVALDGHMLQHMTGYYLLETIYVQKMIVWLVS